MSMKVVWVEILGAGIESVLGDQVDRWDGEVLPKSWTTDRNRATRTSIKRCIASNSGRPY
jgi:hypothetical protein